MTFPNDEERRNYFLKKLREGLEELHAKLGGVPFTTVEDAVERMKSVEKWPMPACRAASLCGAGREAGLVLPALEQVLACVRMAHALGELTETRVIPPACAVLVAAGRPHGEIEDILNLSDPPYYTACPNPFIADFIKHYGKPYDPNAPYSKEPFAADVSEGKNDPIYNAHRENPAAEGEDTEWESWV